MKNGRTFDVYATRPLELPSSYYICFASKYYMNIASKNVRLDRGPHRYLFFFFHAAVVSDIARLTHGTVCTRNDRKTKKKYMFALIYQKPTNLVMNDIYMQFYHILIERCF